jgi:hypothetical protein
MKALALLLMLAPPCLSTPLPLTVAAASTTTIASTMTAQTPTPPPGSLDSSKIRLDAQDATGALADAETALKNGGGADAYAARGDAKRALGRPMSEVIADYAQAAKLDPRYIERYQGLIAQGESEKHPDSKSRSWGKGLNGVPIVEIGAAAAVGGILIAVAVMMLRKREEHPVAPDDEEVKPEGKEDAAGEGHPKAGDEERPPKKEPPKPKPS